MPRKSFNPNLIAGNKTTAAVRKPGATEDGKSIVWNDAEKAYDMGSSGGGSGNDQFMGFYNPASGNFPNYATATTNQFWICNAVGNLQGMDVGDGTVIRPRLNLPGNVAANWTQNS